MKKIIIILSCFLLSTLSVAQQSLIYGVRAIPTELIKQLKSKRVALVANQTSIDDQGRRTIDLLSSQGIKIRRIFAPEHGFDGKTKAGHSVCDTIDRQTGTPIVSLYAHGKKQPHKKNLQDIDIIIFDIQDIGMRHYTYISTLLAVMRAAADHGMRVVVLDRPNIIGGVMEGPVVESPKYVSFISPADIPLRYGVTIGELARYFNAFVLKKPVRLTVVPIQNYMREPMQRELKKFLSPNIQTRMAAQCYSFLGLLGEIAPIDVGVCTPYAFTCITLPDQKRYRQVNWKKLAAIFAKHHVDTRPFCYTNNARPKQLRGRHRGLRLQVPNSTHVDAFALMLDVVQFLTNANVELHFSHGFDIAAGTDQVRRFLQGDVPFTLLQQRVNSALAQFKIKMGPLLLYYNVDPSIVFI